MTVGCDDLCVKVSFEDRSVYLLKIDQSAGAHDISYDAWNYLVFGKSAEVEPYRGGAVNMEYQLVSEHFCKHLLLEGKLPLSASTSMNYVGACISKADTWVAKNHELYNINDPVCHYGWDETCSLNLAVSSQPTCPHILGEPHPLSSASVTNVQYGTGVEVHA